MYRSLARSSELLREYSLTARPALPVADALSKEACVPMHFLLYLCTIL